MIIRNRRHAAIAGAISFILLALGGYLFLRRPSSTAVSAPPSDVILITIDTLRADAVGYSGNKRVNTPFLDALAARGTVFTHAHAHNVITLPSHANLLTGLLPWQHGIRDNAGFTLDAKAVTLAGLLRNAGFVTGAFVSAFPLDSRYGLDNGFDVYDDRYRQTAHSLDFAVQERSGSETFSRASDWWRSNNGRRRFLWVHLYEPHAPYAPPSPFREQYGDDLYLGEVAATDAMLSEAVGPMLQQAPKALLIVTSDHGEALGDHGEKTHGLFAYESTLAVPLIVVDPSRAASTDPRFVRHIDIAPTILQRTGITPPDDWKGSSLFQPGASAPTYFESLSTTLNRGWAPLVGVIADGKKLIELPIPELYDLALDPGEATNLFSEERRSVAALRKILAADAPAPAANRSPLTAEQQSRLLSLGYLSGTSTKKEFTVADDPKNLVDLDNQLHEAIAAYQMGDLRGALARAEALIRARPDMQIAKIMLAFLLGQNQRPEEGISLLQRQLAAGTANEAMRVRLGLMLSETGRAREAIDILRPLAEGSDPDVLNAYGIALADAGDVPGAVQQFERLLTIDNSNAVAYQNLGIVALRTGQPARAREYFAKALALDDALPLTLNALGVIEAQSGNSDAAIALWSRVVALDPSQLDSLYNLGLVAAANQRRQIAIKALRDYLARAPASRYAKERARASVILGSLE